MKKAIFLGMCLVLTGCAALKNMDMKDIRHERYLVESGHLDKNISQIDVCIKKYAYNNNTTIPVIINPQNENQASAISYGTGWTQANPYLCIDFENADNGSNYKAYVVYTTWKKQVKNYIDIINKCK